MADSSSPAPDALAERAERQARLHGLIDGLPEVKRAVFRLVHEAELELR